MHNFITNFGVAVVLLIASASSARADDDAIFIGRGATVADYAALCERPVDKPNYTSRISACFSYVHGAAGQIAVANNTPECLEEMAAGGGSPMRVDAGLFYLATQPTYRNMRLDEAIYFVVSKITAKACRR